MKVKTLCILLALLVVGISSGCSPTPEAPTESSPVQQPSVDDPTFLNSYTFSDEERLLVQSLQDRGTIRIATRELDYVYMPQEDGSVNGFNYRLIKAFADELEISPDLTMLDNFSEYFEVNGQVPEGVKTDPSIVYVPDILQQVDVYCDVLTELPWRQKLFRFIRTVPVRQMLVVRSGEELSSLEELEGQVVTNIKDTSYEITLKEIEDTYGFTLTYHYVDADFKQQESLLTGDADVVIQDSLVAINEIKKNENVSLSIPASELQHLGWGIKHEDEVLGSLLEKFIDYAQTSGLLEDIWQDEYGISMYEYLELMTER